MNAQKITLEQVSEQVKTRISKLNSTQLLNKYVHFSFKTIEEVLVAQATLKRRGIDTNKQVIEANEQFYNAMIAENTIEVVQLQVENEIAEQQVAEPVEVAEVSTVNESVVQTVQQNEKQAVEQESTKKRSSKKQKQDEGEVVKLNGNQFNIIDSLVKGQQVKYTTTNIKVIRGILNSLVKRNLIKYTIFEEDLELTQQAYERLVVNKVPYRIKKTYEDNGEPKVDKTIEIQGQKMSKSQYLRKLMRQHKNWEYQDFRDEILKVGFKCLYPSEYVRCQNQVGNKPIINE